MVQCIALLILVNTKLKMLRDKIKDKEEDLLSLTKAMLAAIPSEVLSMPISVLLGFYLTIGI